MTELLKKAYDPETFRKQGHELVELLANHLQKVSSEKESLKVLNWIPPDELYATWEKRKIDQPNSDINQFFKTALAETTHLHNPKYMGHQTSVPLPASVLAEFFGGFLDVGMGVFEQGNVGVVLEKLLAKKLAAKMGMEVEKADGFFTSGGTLGNLTALLCARQVMIEEDVWSNGFSEKKYAFITSEAAHYSIDRAVRVMGMGEKGIVKAPVNERFQLMTESLEDCYEKAKKAGIQVLGIVANNCATAVGSNDSIDKIADFCELKKLWLHVDAAHGGCVLFSKKYRYLLNGIERADSVIMDFHKMLMVPTLVTAVIFKNGNHSFQTFAQKASYLWDNEDSQEWYNLGKRTFELTKTTMSHRIYAIWKTYGEKVFEENVNTLYDLGKVFAKMISAEGNFQMPVAEPESNIICFRYLEKGKNEVELDELNAKIRGAILEDGEYFILQTRIGERLFMRVSLMNPFTAKKQLKGLLDKIKAIVKKLN